MYDEPSITEMSRSVSQPAPSTPAAVEHDFSDMTEDHRRAWSYFLKAYKVVVDTVDKEVRADAPVSLAEYELLLCVKRAGDRIRFIDLANLTLLSQSRISRQIDTLQAKGFLYREITDTDRRATFAVLTQAGKDAVDQGGVVLVRALHTHFLDRVAPGQLEVLTSILEKLLPDPDFRAKNAAVFKQVRTVAEALDPA
jgi:DNA-binding MarR family transcriptional regulator